MGILGGIGKFFRVLDTFESQEKIQKEPQKSSEEIERDLGKAKRRAQFTKKRDMEKQMDELNDQIENCQEKMAKQWETAKQYKKQGQDQLANVQLQHYNLMANLTMKLQRHIMFIETKMMSFQAGGSILEMTKALSGYAESLGASPEDIMEVLETLDFETASFDEFDGMLEKQIAKEEKKNNSKLENDAVADSMKYLESEIAGEMLAQQDTKSDAQTTQNDDLAAKIDEGLNKLQKTIDARN